MNEAIKNEAEVYSLMNRLRDEYARQRSEYIWPLLDEFDRARRNSGKPLLELINLDGEDFIRAAFSEVLRMEPLAADVDRYLLALKNGDLTKAELLRVLRRSEAGQSVGLRVWGLAGIPNADASMLELPRVPESSGSFETRSAYAVADFLRYHDEEFVRNAYAGILRRVADPDGLQHFLSSLRNGALCKVEVLGRLRFSAEGRAARVPVKGLLVPYCVRTIRRVPFFGRMLGTVQYLVRIADLARNIERIEGELMRSQFQIAGIVNATNARIEKNARQFELRLASSDYGLETAIGAFADRCKQLELANAKHDFTRIAESVAKLEEAVPAISREVAVIAVRLRGHEDKLKERSIAEAIIGTEVKKLAESVAQLEGAALAMERTLELLTTHVRARDDKFDELHSVVVAKYSGAEDGLEKWVGEVGKLRHDMLDLQRRIARFFDDGTGSARRTARVESDAHAALEGHLLDTYYVAFENRFRGSEEEVKARCKIYLPFVREVGAGTIGRPILDVGCGRGEWLQLLRDNSLVACGVDINETNVAKCVDIGLDVAHADAIEWLRSREPNSLGAITGIHIVEHIPFPRLIAFLDESLRTLQPGGIVIFETPNPENLFVGACTFYSDPTHRRPLPPEPIRFLAESRGFDRVNVLRLHPYPDELDASTGDAEVRTAINRAFYGARDYALMAYKT